MYKYIITLGHEKYPRVTDYTIPARNHVEAENMAIVKYMEEFDDGLDLLKFIVISITRLINDDAA